MARTKFFLMAFAMMVAFVANAVPAKRVTKTVMLADGTTVELTLRGDEHFSYYTNADGTPFVLHAEDPEGVYILESRIGWDAGYGDMSIVTESGDYVAEYGFDAVKAQLPEVLGTLKDCVITFPEFESSNGIYQGYLVMGSGAYYGGTNGAFEIYLPSALKDAEMKAKAQSRAKAASFAKRLKAYKMSGTKHAFSKKIVKENAKAVKF